MYLNCMHSFTMFDLSNLSLLLCKMSCILFFIFIWFLLFFNFVWFTEYLDSILTYSFIIYILYFSFCVISRIFKINRLFYFLLNGAKSNILCPFCKTMQFMMTIRPWPQASKKLTEGHFEVVNWCNSGTSYWLFLRILSMRMSHARGIVVILNFWITTLFNLRIISTYT